MSIALLDEVRTVERAQELIVALKERGHRVVLASSAKEPEVDLSGTVLG